MGVNVDYFDAETPCLLCLYLHLPFDFCTWCLFFCYFQSCSKATPHNYFNEFSYLVDFLYHNTLEDECQSPFTCLAHLGQTYTPESFMCESIIMFCDSGYRLFVLINGAKEGTKASLISLNIRHTNTYTLLFVVVCLENNEGTEWLLQTFLTHHRRQSR